MHYLAIDLGDKRTGLAMGDDVLKLPTPVEVVVTSQPHERLKLILKAIETHQPDALVLGLPVNMDGSEGPRAKLTRAFGGELYKATGLTVHYMDERLTSAEADTRLSQSGLTHKQKKQRRDAIAAAAILSDFFGTMT